MYFAEPRLAERVIDAVVHPVARHDEVGLRLREHAVEPLVEVGPGELAAGMARLGESGNRLAGKAQVEELAPQLRIVEPEERLEVFDVAAGVGDAVAQEDHPADAGEGRPGGLVLRP